jgi:hypothetical protein
MSGASISAVYASTMKTMAPITCGMAGVCHPAGAGGKRACNNPHWAARTPAGRRMPVSQMAQVPFSCPARKPWMRDRLFERQHDWS